MNLFTLILALVPFLSFAVAWPTKLGVPNDKQDLTLVYHRANSGISVEALASGALVGRDCSNTLNTGSFAKFPVTFDVDERGSGNLTVGPSTYWIHEHTDHSGGITCGRMYNDVEAAVSCTVMVPVELSMPPLTGFDVTECNTNHAHSLSKTLKAATRGLPLRNSINQTDIMPISPRQGSVCIDQSGTTRWACGDPHQNFYHRQLSGKTNCGNEDSCAVTFNKDGVSVSFTSEMNMVRWTSGDFHVQKKWNSGTNYDCSGNAGETVCVWYKFAHTAYRVQNYYQNTCGWNSHTDPFVLFSPNQDNLNGGQYCVVGPCRYEGDWWWDYDGPTGDAVGNHGCRTER